MWQKNKIWLLRINLQKKLKFDGYKSTSSLLLTEFKVSKYVCLLSEIRLFKIKRNIWYPGLNSLVIIAIRSNFMFQ